MIRMGILALALAVSGPPALAQDTEAEGRAFAAAFTATDLETLARCEARISGHDWLVAEFGPWLEREGHGDVLAAIRRQQDLGKPLKEKLAAIRRQAMHKAGLSFAPSEAAYMAMLNVFTRRAGEDNADAYTRLQPETKLPQECFDAMKRANWSLVDFEKE